MFKSEPKDGALVIFELEAYLFCDVCALFWLLFWQIAATKTYQIFFKFSCIEIMCRVKSKTESVTDGAVPEYHQNSQWNENMLLLLKERVDTSTRILGKDIDKRSEKILFLSITCLYLTK